MYSLKNDYAELAHPKFFENLAKISKAQNASYGTDQECHYAKELMAKKFQTPFNGIHFLSGGTQVNLTFINSALRSFEAVIAPDCGHISVLEAGAIEHNGHKILLAKHINGKISPDEITRIHEDHNGSMAMHMVKPRLVFITQPTERGTLYTHEELSNIFNTCKKLGLYLYIDGARLSTSLASSENNVAANELPKLCDAFYLGATKNGAPLGEALCIVNPFLMPHFALHQKQLGGLLSKSALIGSCFRTMLEDDFFITLAAHANDMANSISLAILSCGYELVHPTQTNQIFAILPNCVISTLQRDFDFLVWEKIDEENSVVRLICSFATKKIEVDRFISILKSQWSISKKAV